MEKVTLEISRRMNENFKGSCRNMGICGESEQNTRQEFFNIGFIFIEICLKQFNQSRLKIRDR